MKRIKKPISFLLTLIMIVSLFQAVAFASDNNGAVAYFQQSIYSDRVYFNNFEDAWKMALENNGTFGILQDWRTSKRYVVSDNHEMTIELNGNVISRGLGKKSWKDDGEVLCVGSGATLNIYGGTELEPSSGEGKLHEEKVYTTSRNENFDHTSMTFSGGMIHGGNSTNGAGGIHMRGKSTLNLFYTTIAGCRAEEPFIGDGGYGGGIMMKGTDCKLNMDHSTICHNYAYNDGGGVFVNNERCKITMKSSHIDYNISDDNGGGIYADDEFFQLEGDAVQVKEPESVINWDSTGLGSSVSHNYITDSDMKWGGGGGLYLDNDDCIVKGINFVDNDADDDGDGGGIYIGEENVLISECNIVNNAADELGGGIKIDNDKTTIENCTIFGNRGRDTGGAGGGVYVYCTCDVNLSGSTVIRGNSSTSHSDDNLYLAGYASAGTTSFVNPSLAPGADVHVRLSSLHQSRVSVVGTFRDDLFCYDNDSNKHIKWNFTDRALYVTDGKKPVKQIETFVPDEGKRTQSIESGYEVDGRNYELLRGVAEYPAFDDEDRDIESVFYYSDGYFMGNADNYNEHLATMSMCLAGAAGYSNIGYRGEDAQYFDKSNNFRQLMSDIGCKDENIYVNDFNTVRPGPYTIGVGIASKELESGDTLVVIGVRGTGYESEWVSNITLGTEGEAYGWSSAAGQIMSELQEYLAKRGIDGGNSKTKFWISGFSRAGATANLVAKRVVDYYDNSGSRTYAYPMEAPRGGVESEMKDNCNYNCIHNVINQNDIVTWVAPREMGFIRYGVDHYVPGSQTTDASNTALDVNYNSDSDYYKQREKMKKNLSAVNSGIVFDDYFQPATIDYVTISDMITTTSNSDMDTVEEFIPFFFEKLQNYGFFNDPENPRNAFAGDKDHTGGKSYEEAIANIACLLMAQPKSVVSGLSGCFGSIPGRMGLGDKITLYEAVRSKQVNWFAYVTAITNPYALAVTIENICHFASEDSNWKSTRNTIWNLLVNVSDEDRAKGYHSIRDYLSDAEVDELKNSYDTLMDMMAGVICCDYAENNQDMLGTMAYNAMRIIMNHYPEVVNSWLRSYDSFYENDVTAVKMASEVKSLPNGVAVKLTAEDGSSERIITDTDGTIEVAQNELVSLIPLEESQRDTGEGIYYIFTSGKESVRQIRAFCYDWNLKEMYEKYSGNNIFKVDVYTTHYDQVFTQSLTFVISGVYNYETPDSYTDGDYVYKNNIMEPNDTLEINGVKPGAEDKYVFTEWTVYPIEGGVLSETPLDPRDYVKYFGEEFDPHSENTTVRCINEGSFKFVPNYEEILDTVHVDAIHLPERIACSFDEKDFEENYMVGWTVLSDGNYTAEIIIKAPEGCRFEKNRTEVEFDSILQRMYEGSFEVTDEKQITVTVNVVNLLPAVIPMFFDNEYYTYEIQSYDVNTGELFDNRIFMVKKFTGKKEFSISAFKYTDMNFVNWECENTSEEDLTKETIEVWTEGDSQFVAKAYYRPVVKSIKAVYSDKVEAGSKLPFVLNFYATITNEWEIYYVDEEWSESDTYADYNTVYTAHLSVKKDGMRASNVTEDGDRVDVTGMIDFADDIEAEIVDQDGNELNVTGTYFYQDDDYIYLDIVFEKTSPEKIASVANTFITVSHNSSENDIIDALPETVYVYLENGRMISVPVVWERTDSIDESDMSAHTMQAYGRIVTDEYDARGINLVSTVYVNAAEETAVPSASVPSGSYSSSVNVELTAEEGATIYYSIYKRDRGEEFKDDPDEEQDFKYAEGLTFEEYSGPILINDYSKAVYLYTYAVKDGKMDSSVIRYRYDLSKPEVKKLEAKEPMIAENGNIECYYSTKLVTEVDPETGETLTEEVPDHYFADEECLIQLDYEEDVLIPAYAMELYEVSSEEDTYVEMFGSSDGDSYRGIQTIGIQSVSDSDDMRMIEAVSSKVLSRATDYGWLFEITDTPDPGYDLTVDNAQFKYSCAGPENNHNGMGIYGNSNLEDTPYKYVTAGVKFDAGSGRVVRSRFYVKLENNKDYIYADELSDSPDIESNALTDDMKDNICFDAERDMLFTGHSLTLDGSIGVNYYLNVTDDMVKNDGVRVDFEWTVEGKKKTRSVTLTEENMYSGRYRACCRVAAAEMTYDITATVTIGGEVQEERNTYSVKRYADTILTDDEFGKMFIKNNGQEKYYKLVDLVYSMLDYGTRAQLKYKRNTDMLANDGKFAFDEVVDPKDIPSTMSMMGGNLSAYGLEYAGTSIVFLTEISIRHYYKIVDPVLFAEVKDSVLFDGSNVYYIKDGDEIYFELKNISVADIDKPYTLRIGNNEYNYAVYDYIRKSLSNPGANPLTQDLVTALYYYNQKAEDYYTV